MTGLTSFSGGMVMFSRGREGGKGDGPNTRTRKFVKCHPVIHERRVT